MTRIPPDNYGFDHFSLVGEASDPVVVFPMNLIFFRKTRKFHGVKSILPFSKLIVGKSQVKHPPFLIFSQKCRDLLVLSDNNDKFGDLTGVKDLTNSMCARVT